MTLSLEITSYRNLRSVAGLVIQATGRTEFEDGLRPGSPGESCLTIPASALAHWSHLCCNTCVAVCEVWENPICLLGAPSASRSTRVQQ